MACVCTTLDIPSSRGISRRHSRHEESKPWSKTKGFLKGEAASALLTSLSSSGPTQLVKTLPLLAIEDGRSDTVSMRRRLAMSMQALSSTCDISSGRIAGNEEAEFALCIRVANGFVMETGVALVPTATNLLQQKMGRPS